MDVRKRRIKVTDLNSLLTCVLCNGYFIDATTISECLHSFCRTCIVKYLQTNKFCPICDVQVHKTRPLMSIRSDQTLQDIVYKVVPGLFKNEMKRRRDFYAENSASDDSAIPISSEKRGDVLGCERLIFTPEDVISMSMEYCPTNMFPVLLHSEAGDNLESNLPDVVPKNNVHRRFFQCQGAVSVYHLKKLLRKKYNLMPNEEIDIMYMHDKLNEEYTLIDLAYIYSWRRNGPMRLFYKFHDKAHKENDTEPEAASFPSPVCETVSAPLSTHSNIPASTPGPSVAAAPSSQNHLQRHPSPPPSPQMAAEPDPTKLINPKSAAMQNKLVNNYVMQSTLKPCAPSDARTSRTREKPALNTISSRRKSASASYGRTLKSATKLNMLNPYGRESFLSLDKRVKNDLKRVLKNSFESNGFTVNNGQISGFQRCKQSPDLNSAVPNKSMNKTNATRLLRKNSL